MTTETLTDTTGVTARSALPLEGNRGGAPEYLGPNPQRQVQINSIQNNRSNPHYILGGMFVEQRKTRQILFLGEQDGVGERALKIALSECFSINGKVDSAFLVRVSFTEVPMPQVALCVKGNDDESAPLVECVGKVFSKLFKTTQHLDILFLSDAQLAEVTRVAKPFYSAAN
jgi:hypothetical protein